MYYTLELPVVRRWSRIGITKIVKKFVVKMFWAVTIFVDAWIIGGFLLAYIFNYYGVFNALINAICRACGY